MVDYAALSQIANTLVAENGRAVTFIKMDRTPADPAKPWRGAAAPTATPAATLAATAVFVEPSSASRLGISSEESDLVKRSTQIMMVALGSESSEDLRDYDQVLDDGTHWKITTVEQLKPGDTSLLFFVGVAR